MKTKCCLLAALVLLNVLAPSLGLAQTKGIQGIQTAGRGILDTVQGIGYVLAVIGVIGIAFAIGTHSGAAALGGIAFALFAIAFILFAEDIVTFLKPGAATAFTGLPLPTPDLLEAWSDLGQQGLWLVGMTFSLRTLRRGRQA